MIGQRILHTDRMETACYHGGTAGAPRLLLIHGNASSSKFYLPLMERLEDRFELAAPDLRCFGDSQALPDEALSVLSGEEPDFADANRIVYAGDVNLLCRAGMIQGIPGGGKTYFRPGNTITRAEVAAIMSRMARTELRGV